MAFGDFTVNRDTTKTVLGKDGFLKTVPVDEPAIEFNADGSYKGLLVEPAATNICKQSEDITTTWIPINATLTANATTAPDGTNTADKLNDDNGGGTNTVSILQGLTVSANTKYTASVFLKADQLSFARIELQDYDGTTDGHQYFGLSGTGSLGTASSLQDSSITVYPNGWYRCTVTWTQGSADTFVELRIYVTNSISNNVVDRDGTSSIFVWGAQVEAGPIATSYIPTTTASVTRAKDDITLGSASSLIGQTEGTIYVEVDWRLATGTTQYLLVASDGTISNSIFISSDASPVELRMYAVANGPTLTQQGKASTAYTGIQKIAFAYNSGDFELYRNGVSISSDQDPADSLAGLATLTDIDLGQRWDAIGQANMWIRAVALFPTRLSDAECQALTTV
jgi:hypothetical protein